MEPAFLSLDGRIYPSCRRRSKEARQGGGLRVALVSMKGSTCIGSAVSGRAFSIRDCEAEGSYGRQVNRMYIYLSKSDYESEVVFR